MLRDQTRFEGTPGASSDGGREAISLPSLMDMDARFRLASCGALKISLACRWGKTSASHTPYATAHAVVVTASTSKPLQFEPVDMPESSVAGGLIVSVAYAPHALPTMTPSALLTRFDRSCARAASWLSRLAFARLSRLWLWLSRLAFASRSSRRTYHSIRMASHAARNVTSTAYSHPPKDAPELPMLARIASSKEMAGSQMSAFRHRSRMRAPTSPLASPTKLPTPSSASVSTRPSTISVASSAIAASR
mmetsp:Transcript_24000/g.61264  ORF Transcript_24000/g.61264 Transcript_24000/m.61264 type:complete len:250 (-) Transcript_24000:1047-1796(-)